MSIRILLTPLPLIGIPLLDLLRREAVDVADVELVHLLTLDDFVAELGHGTGGGDAAATGGGPDLREKGEEEGEEKE